MPNWTWLAVGLVGGYLVARHHMGGGLGFGFSLSASGAAGGGAGNRGGRTGRPLEAWGSTPYVEQGAYNPLFGAGFPDFVNPGDSGDEVNGGPVT